MKEENKEKTVKRTTRKVTSKKTNQKKDIINNEELTPTTNNEIKEEFLINKNEENENETTFNFIEVAAIVLITSLIVAIISGLLVYKNYYKLNIPVEKNKNDELSEFIENYNYIKENYVENVDDKKLIEGAIKGMYGELNDGYSMYLNEDDTSSLDEQLSGEYTGIGIEIVSELKNEDKYTTKINRVFKNTPASEAGLKEGDILLLIDGIEVESSEMIANTIKKGNKESYEITFERDGKQKTVVIKRKKIYIESVTSETYGNVGYIKLDTFSVTTMEQVSKLIKSFDKNVNSLIIDVRDNSGGYLSSAYETADLFIPKGNVIYQLKDGKGEISKYKAKSGVIRDFKKIAVLVNSGSASASEILAIALKETVGAKIVGTTSYGKGTVQETKRLSSGAMVKYTMAYWLSPKGNSLAFFISINEVNSSLII